MQAQVPVEPGVRFYLLFSAILVFFVALSYGVAPAFVLPLLLDLRVEGTDLTHIFRAMMGLYLALISLWIAGATLPRLTLPAVIAETCFMGGLARGRLFSVFADGLPNPILTAGLLLELLFAVWGGWLWFGMRRSPS